ncbi:MAG: hypothetical protein K8S24_03075 [Candidatus Aegiribacteria sp.]|nr:hypothetical protein [Candidatus Aegiribacteria sp.]
MKYFLIFAVIMLMGCDMPGVGELTERVDELETTTAYDDSDIVDVIDDIEDDIEILDERVTAIEHGDIADIQPTEQLRPAQDTPSSEAQVERILAISDIEGLQDIMDDLSTSLIDSITVLDESIESLVLSLDSLTMENDSLRIDLEDLQDKVASLSYTVENMRYTGTTSTSTRSGSSSSSSSGGTSSGSR